MPYCSRCGVEVDEGVPACPLCRAPIQRLDEGEARPGLKPWPEHVVPDELPPLSAKEGCASIAGTSCPASCHW